MSIESPGNQRNGGTADPLISAFAHDGDSLGADILSVIVIGPEQQGRKAVAKAVSGFHAGAVRELPSYPQLDDLSNILKSEFDVIIVELDTNPEHALDLVEHICGHGSATVMVYSAHTDSELLVRCMRAGAREFLTQPVAPSTIAEAMVRASVRRPAHRRTKQAEGKLLMFMGAKGGSGVSTVAANFAVALTQESRLRIALLDLNLPFGNTAIDLGLTAPLSSVDALTNLERLDSHFLSTVMIKHSCGLSVLAAPDRYSSLDVREDSIARLVNIVRQDFEYVIVDAGAGMGLAGRALLSSATAAYLVLQVSLPELRNANRIISQYFQSDSLQLEIVLNRFNPRSIEIDEEAIKKALTTSAKWRVPSDYAAVRKAQNTASPIALEASPISQVIRQMARSAPGYCPAAETKKKKFSIFGLT
jgi:pilus assembly protein CpaE